MNDESEFVKTDSFYPMATIMLNDDEINIFIEGEKYKYYIYDYEIKEDLVDNNGIEYDATYFTCVDTDGVDVTLVFKMSKDSGYLYLFYDKFFTVYYLQ